MVSHDELASKAFDSIIQAKSAKIMNPSLRVKKLNNEQQVVYGEVYAPNIIDSHGAAMKPEDVQTLAHRFMMDMKNNKIDLMHNNKPTESIAVESFIAREGDPDYTPGAWVLAVKVLDSDLWASIKKGTYNGFSMEAWVNKKTETVQIQIQKHVFGLTENNNGHEHAFYVEMNDDGKVVRGITSEVDGHTHTISISSATEFTDDHTHRFFLP